MSILDMNPKIAGSYAPILTSGPMTDVSLLLFVCQKMFSQITPILELLVTVGPNARHIGRGVVNSLMQMKTVSTSTLILTSGPITELPLI